MQAIATQLVFTTDLSVNAVPYTTSEVIAGCADIERRSVTRLINKHKRDLEEFGKVRFQIAPSKNSATGQKVRSYLLNEQQATLLITYLDNTEPVRQFKKALVRQFYAMREELQRAQLERAKQVPVRRSLTDAIQARDMDEYAYARYTDLAYRQVLGQPARAIRAVRGAKPKATAADFLTADENRSVTEVTSQIAVLIDRGKGYEEIKKTLNGWNR